MDEIPFDGKNLQGASPKCVVVETIRIKSMVPQREVIGLLLFLLFTNDHTSVINVSTLNSPTM